MKLETYSTSCIELQGSHRLGTELKETVGEALAPVFVVVLSFDNGFCSVIQQSSSSSSQAQGLLTGIHHHVSSPSFPHSEGAEAWIPCLLLSLDFIQASLC